MTIICTAEEKETFINVIQTGNTCFHDWKCIPSCRECIEKNIDFITDDDVEVCKKGEAIREHGHLEDAKNQAYWIHAKGNNNVWYCSGCGEKILYNPTRRTYRPIGKPDVSEINKFCRGCGKRMTGSVWYADEVNKPTKEGEIE